MSVSAKDSPSSLELQSLETLLSVAETGSFRKAACQIGVGQSAISRRVQRLEDVLGVSLFERRPSGVRLTATGRCFALQAKAVLDNLEIAIERARSGAVAATGQLRLGIIASLSRGPLRNLLTTFLAEHQDVELSITEVNRSELLIQLSHRRLDAIIAAGEPNAGNGDSLLFAYEKIFLAVSSQSAWAERSRLGWHDVLQANFIASTQEPGPEIHEYIIRRVSDLGRPAAVRRHRVDREGIMNLVGLGLGVSLVADHWRGVRYPNVTFVPIGDEHERVPFSLTWRPENDNPALRRFVSLARVEAKKVADALSAASQSPDPSP